MRKLFLLLLLLLPQPKAFAIPAINPWQKDAFDAYMQTVSYGGKPQMIGCTPAVFNSYLNPYQRVNIYYFAQAYPNIPSENDSSRPAPRMPSFKFHYINKIWITIAEDADKFNYYGAYYGAYTSQNIIQVAYYFPPRSSSRYHAADVAAEESVLDSIDGLLNNSSILAPADCLPSAECTNPSLDNANDMLCEENYHGGNLILNGKRREY